MRSERRDLTGDARGLAKVIRALVPPPTSVSAQVAEIVNDVASLGDAAVHQYAARFDGAPPASLTVPHDQLADAARHLPHDVRAGLERAIDNVGRVAEAGLQTARSIAFDDGHEVILRYEPVDRAAVYVPGGRAPYPSTVVMGVVTAQVAGVDHVEVVTPAGADGQINPVVLGACALVGVDAIHLMGGAQAIAALAYGTESVTSVDVIVGPGNLYVQEAKRQVSQLVGIDGFAGPSDLVIVADAGSDPGPLALDLLAQAEHGPGTLVIAISSSSELLDALAKILDKGPDSEAVAVLVDVPDTAAAIRLAEQLAPEHLQLVGPEAEREAHHIRRAGCLFVGAAGATAFGDYIAGSNHILPTAGAARFASGLSPATFTRSFAEVRIGGADAGELARAAAPIARAEGFELHAKSMEARIQDNGS
jgi:histidinol dehydrogenase